MSANLSEKELKKPDEFVGFFSRLAQYIKDHASTVTWFLAGLLVVGLGTAAWLSVASMKNAKAADELNAILGEYPSMYSEKSFTSDSWKGLLERLSSFRKTHAGSSLADAAGLYQAHVHMKLTQYAEAETLYRRLETKLRKPYSYLAYEGEAESLLEQKKYPEAEKIWRYLSEANDNPMQAKHLWSLAMTLEFKNARSEALKVLQDLEAKFPNSPLANRAKSKIAELSNS